MTIAAVMPADSELISVNSRHVMVGPCFEEAYEAFICESRRNPAMLRLVSPSGPVTVRVWPTSRSSCCW